MVILYYYQSKKIERGIKEYHFESVNITGIITKVLDILEYQLTVHSLGYKFVK